MFRDLGRSIRLIGNDMRTDLSKAQRAFDLGCQNMGLLNEQPHPAEIIAQLDTALCDLLNLPPNNLFSFPSVRNYQFPGYKFQLTEARRTFSTKPHTGFYDPVVGLHIFSSGEKDEYYFGVSTFQPVKNPYSLFETAQTDPDIDPRHLMGFYNLQKFNSDEVAPAMLKGVATAMQRAALL
jgi:hypothetical protein